MRSAPGGERRRGGGAIALVAVSLVFILFFPHYAVQWIGYLIVFLVALSYGYSRVIDSGLTVLRMDGDLVTYRYDDATVRISIRNRSILPIPQLVLVDNPGTLYSGYENARLLSLRRGEERVVSYDIRGMYRGSYRIGPITVRYSDPLGIFPVEGSIPAEVRLVVYPLIHPVHVPTDSGLPSGTITAAKKIYEDPTRYKSVREYAPGDELRRINWKVSARTGRLHSTEWLPTINFPVLCLLNLTSPEYERRHRYHHIERTIDAAASLVNHLAERGQPVGLVSTGVLHSGGDRVLPCIPVAAGTGRASSILQTLAELQPNDRNADIVSLFLENGAVPFGTRVFYLGPPLAPERVAALLAGSGHRSLVRLHYTDEQVADWRSLAVESVDLWRITEFGDEIFIHQA